MKVFLPEPNPKAKTAYVGFLIMSLVLSLLMLNLTLGSKILSYRVQDNSITVGSRTGMLSSQTQFDTRNLKAQQLTISGGLRLWGTAISGYCQGKFRYPETGEVQVYSTCSREVVWLKNDTHSVVITPQNPEAFLNAISKQQNYSEEQKASGFSWQNLLFVPVFVIAVMLPVMMISGRGRLRYEIHDKSVVLYSFMGRTELDKKYIKAQIVQPQVGFRVFGTAFPGYYVGIFNTKVGRVNMVASHVGEGVLLEVSGKRFLITPSDKQSFIHHLQQFS